MVLWNRINSKADPSKLPLVEGQVLIHEQENGATMYIDTDAYDDGQIKRYVIGGATDPGTRLGFGTWELLSEGQTLWSTTPTSSVTVGTEIAAGLPNIKGDVGVTYEWTRGDAFTTGAQKANSQSGSNWAGIQTGFNAAKGTFGPSGKISEANSPYGKSDTVQPPAIAVYMWKRVS